MLSTSRLQLLVHLYNLKTIKAVANATQISSAAVSTQLKLLETETNTVLIERRGRNVQLTMAGVNLVSQVQPILDQLEQLNNNFQYPTKVIQGNVRIVGLPSALRTIVIPVIASLKSKYPKINITFTEKNSNQSLVAINSHQCDLALVGQFKVNQFNPQRTSNEWSKLGYDHLRLLINRKNKLAQFNTLNLSQMQNVDWLLDLSDHQAIEYIKHICIDNNVTPQITGIVNDYSLINNMVTNDLAIGFVPELAIESISKEIKSLDLQPDIKRDIYLVNRKPSFLVPAVNIVAKAIQLQAHQLFHSEEDTKLIQ